MRSTPAVSRALLFIFQNGLLLFLYTVLFLLILAQLDPAGVPVTVMASVVAAVIFTYYYEIAMKRKSAPLLTFEPLSLQGNDIRGRGPMATCRLMISNKEPDWWHSRDPALRCFARISVYRSNGRGGFDLVESEACGRWASLPQPLPLAGPFAATFNLSSAVSCEITGTAHLYDPSRYDPLGQDTEQRMDIFPGQSKELDIVCRYLDEDQCFVWNNQYCQPDFLSQALGLQKDLINLSYGTYFVRVKLFSSSAETEERVFRLTNTEREFKLSESASMLEELSSTDRENQAKIKEFRRALQEGNPSLMHLLRADPSYVEFANFGSAWRPLMICAMKGNCELVDVLLNLHASVDAVEDFGYTALMFAASQGHVRVVDRLIAAGADVNIRGLDGRSALILAAMKGSRDTIIALQNAGAQQ